MIGGVGTLAYYVLGYLTMRLIFALNPDASPMPVALILIPLLPGMIPGGLMALPFSATGFHDTSFFVGSLISAPVVNSVFVYFWMKSRSRLEGSE